VAFRKQPIAPSSSAASDAIAPEHSVPPQKKMLDEVAQYSSEKPAQKPSAQAASVQASSREIFDLPDRKSVRLAD